MLKKAAHESKIKRMITGRFGLKRAVLATLGSKQFPINKASVAKVAIKTLKSYKERIKADESLSKTLSSSPRQFIQRVQNEVVFQIHQGIKKNYKGQKARWLPSDADDPRPEHQANYGKTFIIGEGIGGIEPGDEPGCKCGVEILNENESQLDLG